jgi:hypothetical protein
MPRADLDMLVARTLHRATDDAKQAISWFRRSLLRRFFIF